MQESETIMNERTIDAALRVLGQNVPRAPESSVERMLKAVRELSAARAAQTEPMAAERQQPERRRDISPPTGKMTM